MKEQDSCGGRLEVMLPWGEEAGLRGWDVERIISEVEDV